MWNTGRSVVLQLISEYEGEEGEEGETDRGQTMKGPTEGFWWEGLK